MSYLQDPLPSDSGASQAGKERALHPGMKKGFTLSPMGELATEYSRQTDVELSLFIRSTSMVSKKSLDLLDVLDRGVPFVKQPIGRFGLDTGLFLRTERTINDMQDLLTRAASLVQGRNSTFVVDLHRILITVLKSANELDELHATWLALSERMDLAQRSFKKYQSEFSAEKEEDILLSPISTAPEVYSVFPKENSTPAEDVCYLYDHVPNLQKLWPQGYQSSSDWLLHVMGTPSYLERAFPDRMPEERPSTVFYSADGQRQEASHSVRSSYGAGPQFQAPENFQAKLSRAT
jgi:hypothetical protein